MTSRTYKIAKVYTKGDFDSEGGIRTNTNANISTPKTGGKWKGQKGWKKRTNDHQQKHSAQPGTFQQSNRAKLERCRGQDPAVHLCWANWVECDIGTDAQSLSADEVADADWDTCPNVELLNQLDVRVNAAKRLLTPLSKRRQVYDYFRGDTAPLFKASSRLEMAMKAIHGERVKVTNAFLKFTEILSVYHEYIDFEGKFFLNAEYPGAFTQALLEFVRHRKLLDAGLSSDNSHQQQRPQQSCQTPFETDSVDWRASSYVTNNLNKYKLSKHEKPLKDVYGLRKKYPDRWMMDETISEGDGDMQSPASIHWLVNKVGRSSCDTYTHDAALGIENTDIGYSDQEVSNAKLHLGCALTGFLTLKEGGFFLAKQFTMFDRLTIHLMYIYSQLFEAFYVIKPSSSRCTNSEIYLVGIGFKGIPKDIEKLLFRYMEDIDLARKYASAPCKFIGTVASAAYKIYETQIRELELMVDEFNVYVTSDRHAYKTGAYAQSKKISEAWLARVGYDYDTMVPYSS